MKVPFDQIKEHEEKCIWRLVCCPDVTCKAMIPFCSVRDHVEGCSAGNKLRELSGKTLGKKINISKATVDAGKDYVWHTAIVRIKGQIFFLRIVKRNRTYMCDVVMEGTKEDCKGYVVKASVVNMETGQPVYKAIFPPKPLDDQKEAKYCLAVSEEAISDVWKFDMARDMYQIRFDVNIKKTGNV